MTSGAGLRPWDRSGRSRGRATPNGRIKETKKKVVKGPSEFQTPIPGPVLDSKPFSRNQDHVFPPPS